MSVEQCVRCIAAVMVREGDLGRSCWSIFCKDTHSHTYLLARTTAHHRSFIHSAFGVLVDRLLSSARVSGAACAFSIWISDSSSLMRSLSTSTSSRTANIRWDLTRSIACSILLSMATSLWSQPALFPVVLLLGSLHKVSFSECPFGIILFAGTFFAIFIVFCWLSTMSKHVHLPLVYGVLEISFTTRNLWIKKV